MLIAAAVLLGGFVVGPFLAHAVLRWVGWRVYLPFLFGRVPGRRELGRSRPACRRCGSALTPLGLPVLPWLAVLGRCRSCREPIAWWVGAVEIATAVSFGLLAWGIGRSTRLLPALALAAGLVAISAVDLVCSRIPSRFVYLTALAVAVTGSIWWVARPESAVGALVGGGLCLLLLGAMHLSSPQMLGFGDVRLGTLIGAVVGWLGWTADEPLLDPLRYVVSAMIFAGLLGSLAGLVLLAVRRRNVAYPFGPFLALGAMVVLLA